MALAVIFPGQGSQAIGMGKALNDAFPEAKAVFEAVDDALGEKLSDVMWNGPEDALTLTANTQPALMAVSVAAIKAMETRGFSLAAQAKFVAGHSLGEYSALCASGSLSIEDTAKLLRIRGNAMQAAVPVGKGAMAAIIGLEYDDVKAICADVSAGGETCCQIANDNGGGQLVISGTRQEVETAAAMATEKGAKRALMLPVSAPFHSALMEPAAEAMKEALADVTVSAPVVPLVANVTAQPTTDPDAIRDQLVTQVCGTVRWRESFAWMAENGIDLAMEAGSGKVLTGLGRRIARDVKGIAVGGPDDIDAALEAVG